MNWTYHPTKTCPQHPERRLLYTQTQTQLVCVARDCTYYERVEEAQIPKEVARAIRKLRKRTRRILAKHAECTCSYGNGGQKYKSGHGHAASCARFPYEAWRYWKRRRKKQP